MTNNDKVAERPQWHALLAPVPADVRLRRQLVASPTVLASAAGDSIAGWEQIVAELSAGGTLARVVLVTVDEAAQLLSASDMVIYRSDSKDVSGTTEVRHESIGGRFEPGGRFLGTRWVSTALERGESEQLDWDAVPNPASVADGAALRALGEDLLQRAPRRGQPDK